MYFDTPTQVLFYNTEEFTHTGGIAFENYVICGCCGSVIMFEEIMERTPEGKAWLVVMPWLNLSRAIEEGSYFIAGEGDLYE